MKKIVNLSRILKWTALGFCIFLPVSEAGYWITEGYRFLDPIFKLNPLPSFGNYPLGWGDLNGMQRFLGFFVNLIPLAFSTTALFSLSQLFQSFQNLDLFSLKNVKILKRAGWALVLGQIAHPFYIAFLSLSLTYRNPVGHRNISIAIGNMEIQILAIGLSILLISWVLGEAAKMQEEVEATV